MNANYESTLLNKKTPEEFLVKGLEAIEPAYAQFPGKMYAGMLPATHAERSSGEIMFWMFEPDVQSVPDSLVIWLNGGPGCSSFNCGVMMEHSPVTQPLHDAGYCCLQAQPHLSYNNASWTRATTMLYVEQPIGTGFSFGSPLPENETQVSADLYAFLGNFFNVFEHLRPYDFYVFGESYAGMFVPSIARYIHLKNLEQPKDSNKIIPIKGAAIGNGWMDARVQGPATIDYSWWHGLIDQPTRDALHTEWTNCMDYNFAGGPPFHPFNIQDDCGIMWGILVAAGFPNAYDITTWDPNVDQITFTSEVFYNRPDVKKLLHAPMNITWHGCRQGAGRRRRNLMVEGDGAANEMDTDADRHHRRMLHHSRKLYMDNDRPISVVPYVADLVDAGIPVIVYNGDRDMTTNMVGSELLLNRMEWSGQEDWLDAPRGLWMVDGHQAGWAKELDSLTYLVVYNSGHMVPYNRPGPAFDLLERFLRRESFIDQESPQIRVQPVSRTMGVTSPSLTSFQRLTMIGASSSLKEDFTTSSLLDTISSTNLNSIVSPHRRMESLVVAGLGMVLGVLFTLMIVKLRASSSSRRGRQYAYEVVPDLQ